MAITVQVQPLQCNMPDLRGMGDESKKANFPVIPLVAVDFLFRNCSPFPSLLTHVTQLCSCNTSLFAMVLNVVEAEVTALAQMLHPCPGSFSKAVSLSLSSGFLCGFSAGSQWPICFSLQDVGLLEIPAELAALLHFVEGEKSSSFPPFPELFHWVFPCLYQCVCLFSLLLVTALDLIHYPCSVNMIKANGAMDVVSWHGRKEKQLGPGSKTPAWKSVSLLIFQFFFWTGLVELMAGMVQSSLVKLCDSKQFNEPRSLEEMSVWGRRF